MILQLNPPIPMHTPKGEGLAWLVIDQGIEFNLLWVICQNETGEIWTWDNTKVRGDKNIMMDRLVDIKKAEIKDRIKSFDMGGMSTSSMNDADDKGILR